MRGKKTSPEDVYKVMTSWSITQNYADTAREVGLPESTVKSIVCSNKDKPEFVELRAEKVNEFSAKATKIINKAMERLERTIDDEEKDIPVNQLTTAIGTLYDKRALADGKPTENVNIISDDKIDKLAELAGYIKKR